MIIRYLQNSIGFEKGIHGATARPVLPPRGGVATPLGNLLDGLRASLAKLDRKRRVEYENRKAIAHLESLTDEQLRDVGIQRLDIERCVRRGREAI